MKNYFYFLNHASYMVENNNSILLVDPWLEGYAFDKGWSLLDKSTSIDQLINFLQKKKKKLFIWYSHEHSDHLHVPFLKYIKKKKITSTIYYQKTLDRRVVSFIKKIDNSVNELNSFEIIENNNKKNFLDNNLSLVTFPYAGGDSYCLTMIDGYAILNLNDCVVATKNQAKVILNSCLKFCDKIDILLTQFGYANWIGNIADKLQRKISANEHIVRIANQFEIIKPEIVIPFASFITFCHEENFYMNDSQNSPKKILTNVNSLNFRDRLIVMKPWDSFEINNNFNFINAQIKSKNNAEHWESCINRTTTETAQSKKFSLDELICEYTLLRKKIFKEFLILPHILEFFGLIEMTKIYITDLKKVFVISFLKSIKIEDYENIQLRTVKKYEINNKKLDYDISMNSETFFFGLKYEYGFNAIHVNGKFQSFTEDSFKKVFKHFFFQDAIKLGFGINNFFLSIKSIFFIFWKKIYNYYLTIRNTQ